MEISIRKAENRDIPRIIELLYQVCRVHADKRPDLFKAGAKKYDERDLAEIIADAERPVFVAESGGEVLGYAFCILQRHEGGSYTPHKTLYIDDLCVDKRSRGQHVGTALYNHVLQFAREIGCYNVTLNVWECNESARKFYEKCGLSIQKYGMEQIL